MDEVFWNRKVHRDLIGSQGELLKGAGEERNQLGPAPYLYFFLTS
jgi:hypothetical protein